MNKKTLWAALGAGIKGCARHSPFNPQGKVHDTTDGVAFQAATERRDRDRPRRFGLEQMPCGEVCANAVFFRLGVLAYNLFIGCTRLACPAAWAAHTIATVR